MKEVTAFYIRSVFPSPTSQRCVNIAFNICTRKTGTVAENVVIVTTGFVQIQLL